MVTVEIQGEEDADVGATLVVARFARADVGVHRQGDHKPGWTTPVLVVNRQGDHKGRPYSGFFFTLNLNSYCSLFSMVARMRGLAQGGKTC